MSEKSKKYDEQFIEPKKEEEIDLFFLTDL